MDELTFSSSLSSFQSRMRHTAISLSSGTFWSSTVSLSDELNQTLFSLNVLLLHSFRTHMEDLRSRTVEVLYENYRSTKLLSELGGSATGGSKKGDNTKYYFLVPLFLLDLLGSDLFSFYYYVQ